MWKEHTDKSFSLYNEIRWYSKYEVLEVMATLFPFIETVMEAVV